MADAMGIENRTGFNDVVADNYLEAEGNSIGGFAIEIDASQWRGGGEVAIDKVIPAGYWLKTVQWRNTSTSGARSINIGVVGDSDKFVDNQSMSTSANSVNNLTTTAAALVTAVPEQLAIQISAVNNTQRGTLVLEFVKVNVGLAD